MTGWRAVFAWGAVVSVTASGLVALGSALASEDLDAWRRLWFIASMVAGWYAANRVVDQ